MIHFVGAGPGAPDLITVRGQKLLEEADVIIYAGSLVNPELLQTAGEGCQIYNSAYMTLEEVLKVMEDAEKEGLTTVRLHTGDPSIYGAVREQMEELEKRGIPYDVTPGVSSFCGAAAALGMEYTLPGVSQSVILTRMEGRTKVPEKESIESFAAHQATMVPFVCTIDTLEKTAADNDIDRTALIIVGEAVRYNGAQHETQSGDGRSLQSGVMRSRLYDADFETGYRSAKSKE